MTVQIRELAPGGYKRADPPEYSSWSMMIQRCTNPKRQVYNYYGGRGIRVCDQWLESFQTFLEDVGPRPSSMHSLDRIDNDQDYKPGNVRWATKREQANNRRSNVILTHHGQSRNIFGWAREIGMAPDTLMMRLASGWSVERALTQKLRPIRRSSP